MDRVCNITTPLCSTLVVKSPCVQMLTQGAVHERTALAYIIWPVLGYIAGLSTSNIQQAIPHHYHELQHCINSMWSLRLILVTWAFMLNTINAAPSPPCTSMLDTRDIANVLAPTTIGVYFCLDSFWKGGCQYLKNGPGLCSMNERPSFMLRIF